MMKSRSSIRNALAALAVVATASGAGAACDTVAPDESHTIDASQGLPATLARRALTHVRGVADAGLAEGWHGASLGEARALYRKDVDGVAYWEVAVLDAQGAPAGYVTLATAAHDAPIVEWRSEGAPASVQLAARLDAGTRVLRVEDALALEDAHGAIVATTLTGSDPAQAWSALEARALDPSSDVAIALADAAAAAWQRSERAESDPRPAGARSTSERSCGVAEAPDYNQLAPGEVGNTWSYFSGCGGTAWALLIGWIDQRAGENDPKWAPYRGIYRLGGAASTGAADTIAPKDFDWGVRLMVNQLRQDLGSIGWPHNDNASTDIYQMGRVDNYLNRVGLGTSYLDVPTHHIGGAPWPGLRDDAIGYLCDRQQPAILGINNSEHYGLATHYYRDTSGNEWFYVNMGWGGPRQWMWPPVFFVGSLDPRSTPPAPPARTGTIEVLEATYGNKRDNASASLSAQCNGQWSCTYGVSVNVLGDPQYGVTKPFSVRYRCGGTLKSAYIGAEANGQSTTLSCPRPVIIRPPVGVFNP